MNLSELRTSVFTKSLLLGGLLVLLVSSLSGQNIPVLREGKSLGVMRIGKSSESDVVKYYGDQFSLITHKEYSYEMRYEALGLQFYYCLNDPNREIFAIGMAVPFKVKTSRGIVLGKHKLLDVFRRYGRSKESTAGFRYRGVSFYVAPPEMNDGSRNDSRAQQVRTLDTETKAAVLGDGAFTIDLNYYSERKLSTRETRTERRKYARYLESLENSPVSKVELFERRGIRQCDVQFRK